LLAPLALLATLAAQPQPDYVPKLGEFPPPNAGHYFAGELVEVDHVNRRGALRLVGDNDDSRYHAAPSHKFALLPYGTVRYHGAPAELRDVPIGTMLHGFFVLPPAGDTTIPPPTREARYVPRYNHALSLEDDCSFYQRQGQAWKIVAADPAKQRLQVTATGKAAAHGLTGEQSFSLDASTRIWKGRGLGTHKDLAPGQEVQINLTWAPDWQNGHTDVWIDPESREVAAEVQRQIHVRHQRHRWLAGWVDHVEHHEGGKGVVTLTLFGGMDPSLYDEARKSRWVKLACAEPTLRTYWQEHDSKPGPVVETKTLPNPPMGSSGLQVRVKIDELLEGFRPGRIVRLKAESFPNVKMPPEERIKDLNDR
jgi:hypothetical protein